MLQLQSEIRDHQTLCVSALEYFFQCHVEEDLTYSFLRQKGGNRLSIIANTLEQWCAQRT